MTCQGQNLILASDICFILSKINPSLGQDLRLFHDKLRANVDGIVNHIQEYNRGYKRLYEVLITILENWIGNSKSDATVGVLRSVLRDIDLALLADNLHLTESNKKYFGAHICRHCKVIGSVQVFTPTQNFQSPYRSASDQLPRKPPPSSTLHNSSILTEQSEMSCNGKAQITHGEVSNILSAAIGSSDFELLQFHNSLNANVDRIERLIEDKTMKTYSVLAKIIDNWTDGRNDATVLKLRNVLRRMKMLNLAGALTDVGYSKYLALLELDPEHICDSCKIGREMIPFEPDSLAQRASKLLQSDYDIKGLLGAGGFGVVLECYKVNEKYACAIKLTPATTEEGNTEVQNNRKLSGHPNIVNCHTSWINEFTEEELKPIKELLKTRVPEFMDFGGRNKIILFCIYMELCGGDLRKWIETQTTVDEPLVTSLFRQIICGIQHIHKKGYIHRDIKPENIFFEKDSSTDVKIGDMGIAIQHGLVEKDDSTSHTTGAGSKFYLAPEQKGDTYDKTVDIYAAGIILMEMLHPIIQPKRSGSSKAFVQAINDLTHNRSVPAEVEKKFPNHSKLILKLVQYKPEDRPACVTILRKIDDLHKPKMLSTPKISFSKKQSSPDDKLDHQEKEKGKENTESNQKKSATSDKKSKGVMNFSNPFSKKQDATDEQKETASADLTNRSGDTSCIDEEQESGETTEAVETKTERKSKVKSRGFFNASVAILSLNKKQGASGPADIPTDGPKSNENNNSIHDNPTELYTPSATETADPNVAVASSPATYGHSDAMYNYKEVRAGECNACTKTLTPKRYICSYCTNYKLCRDCFKDEEILPEHKAFHIFTKNEPVADPSASVIGSLKRTFSTKT